MARPTLNEALIKRRPAETTIKMSLLQRDQATGANTTPSQPPLLAKNEELHQELLAWFNEAKRDFPWRSRSDPYAILIAEKLLQQTAAREVVIQAYGRVLDQYPSPQRLAKAALTDLEAIIHPLGLKYRAGELLTLAQTIVERHEGEVPNTLVDLLALPGIGDYSARAILCFGFGADVPIVDTNVARFVHRLYGLEEPVPKNPARNRGLIEMAGNLIPTGKSNDFNMAVLDLCALICKPSNPSCWECPVQNLCAFGSYAKGDSDNGNG